MKHFETVVGPEMPKSSVQQICILQECQTTKNKSKRSQGLSFMSLVFLHNACLLDFTSDLVFEQFRLSNNLFSECSIRFKVQSYMQYFSVMAMQFY